MIKVKHTWGHSMFDTKNSCNINGLKYEICRRTDFMQVNYDKAERLYQRIQYVLLLDVFMNIGIKHKSQRRKNIPIRRRAAINCVAENWISRQHHKLSLQTSLFSILRLLFVAQIW